MIATADVVLIDPRQVPHPPGSRRPSVREALDGFELAWSGTSFLVYRRIRPAAATPDSPTATPPDPAPGAARP